MSDCLMIEFVGGPKDVAPMVEQFVRDGHAEIGTWKVRDCSVPMVRIKPGIVPGKRRRK